LTALFELKDASYESLKDVKTLFKNSFPELDSHIDNLINIVNFLESAGCRYSIDIASGRGFEYYTGVIFQLHLGENEVGGGGRYDALIPLMGGGDVPASGFALYFDYLLNLIEPAGLSQPSLGKVLIKTGSGMIGRGLDIARRLHEAGYIAQFQLGEPPADFRWLLEVQDETPIFVVTDQVGRQRYRLDTMVGVLKLLGGGDDNKDSTA
jgi:histidyl-tRNA synthetase